jgi:hypothetical protein
MFLFVPNPNPSVCVTFGKPVKFPQASIWSSTPSVGQNMIIPPIIRPVTVDWLIQSPDDEID